ncbi:MAG: hypothetical protein LBT59_18610 [Clostridiales bacterium]|jgi:hypothetical protein|nr:hypothetical protein [Clostridiales bacterium]
MDDEKAVEQLLKSKKLPEDNPNLDDELEALLRDDKVRESQFDDLESLDFIKDVSVFDPELHGSSDPGDEFMPASPRLNIIKKRDMRVVAVICLSILIAVNAAAYYFIRQYALEREALAAIANVLYPPAAPANNSAFIFANTTDRTDPLGEMLSKFSLGPLSTVIYLNQPLGDRRTLSLESLEGMAVGRDLALSLPKEVLAYRSLGEGDGFRLKLGDKLSDYESSIDFTLFSPAYSSLKSLVKPVPFSGSGGSIEVIGADFSNTGSTLCLQIKQAGALEYDISESSHLSLFEGVSPLFARSQIGKVAATMQIKAYPSLYHFPENRMILARMDFEPLRSLEGTVTARLSSCVLDYSPDTAISAVDLFDFANKGSLEKNMGDYTLVFEGMQRQGPYIVMVMHCDSDTGERVETKLDASLLCLDESGEEVIFDGKCISKKEGADILFEIGSNPSISLDPGTMKVHLKHFSLALPDLSATIDLSQLETEIDPEVAKAKKTLEDSFVRRLRYKTGTLGLSDITGFLPDILTREDLLELYTPLKASSPSNTAQAIVVSTSGGILLCGVNERWQTVVDKRELSATIRHKVKAAKIDNRWVVTEDEILQIIE